MKDEEGKMRTNEFLETFPPNEHSWAGKVTISFGYPEHGWIQMAATCTAYVQGVILELSSVFDPFPALIHWLEDIAAGRLPSQFIVDEEGEGKVLHALPANEGTFLFMITEWILGEEDVVDDVPLYMYVHVSKQQFLSEFLRRWDELVNEKFDPEHWKESDVDLRTLDVSKIRMAAEK